VAITLSSVVLYRQQVHSIDVVDAYLAECRQRQTYGAYKAEGTETREECNLLAHVEHQDGFMSIVIRDPCVEIYPVEREYTRRVLAEYIRRIEGRDTEFSEDLLESYASACRSGAPEKIWYKTFTLGPETTVAFRVGHQFHDVGQSVWPSGLVLVNFLLANPPSEDVTVLELGCGVGLSAMCLHGCTMWAQHTRRMILTDYTEEVLANVSHNLFDVNRFDRSVVEISLLDWTKCEENEVRIRRWQAGVIVAADVIYDVKVIEPLARTIEMCLRVAGNKGVCIVAQTFRNESSYHKFLELLSESCTIEFVRRSQPCEEGLIKAVEGNFVIDMANLASVFLVRLKR